MLWVEYQYRRKFIDVCVVLGILQVMLTQSLYS